LFTTRSKEHNMPETVDSLEVPVEPVIAELVERAEVAEPVVLPPAELPQQQRQKWAERIRSEQRLPGALRDRLAALVSEAASIDGNAEPQLSVSQVAGVFAEAMPMLLALDGPRMVAPHPGGEAFFRAGQLSDDDAARIAREQLARTGFAQ
jgi:hypothetical protein